MDKNKDFIRLDDLFRSLGQGEASYQPGAWGEMKSLLDEQLPINESVASGSSLMRFLIPLLALLLAGTGFYFWNNNRQTNLAITTTQEGGSSLSSESSSAINAQNNNNIPEHSQPPYHQPESSAIAGSLATTKNQKERVTPRRSVKKQNKALNTTNPSIIAINNSTGNTNLQSNIKEQTVSEPVSPFKNQSKVENEITSSPNKTVNPPSAAKIDLLRSEQLSRLPESVQLSAQPMAISTNIVVLQLSLPVLEKEQVLHQWKPIPQKPLKVDKHLDLTKELVASNRLEKIENKDNLSIYKSENGGLYKEQRDTFKRLELAKRLHDGYSQNLNKPVKPILDTVSFKQIARVSFVPLSYAEIKAYHLLSIPETTPLIPESKVRSSSVSKQSASVDMIPLKHYKVSSRKMDASAISKLIHSANSGLAGLMEGSKPWYISLILGGNAGLGSPNAYGMQIGANFLYAIAERWTLSLGVKYQNSYYPNFRFWDSAISYGSMHKDRKQVGTVFTGTEYQKQTTVSVNSLGRISAPILLSYNLGRVSLFGGPEFSYFFPMQKETTTSFQSHSVSKLVYDNKNPFIDVPYRLNTQTDFRSRFAAGYTLGLSYDFSRKFSIDVRMSQMLWDNTGKYQLDALQSIYHQPTVELNLGFFLGRREKVIYIMDRNH